MTEEEEKKAKRTEGILMAATMVFSFHAQPSASS